MNRTIVIGDLHGCFDEARALLDSLAVQSDDRVIFAGDLVDRGPSPRACVELAMKHECVLGNHEEKHLLSSHHHEETRKELRDEHYAYFRKLPTFIRLPAHNAVVVHAGLMPNVPVEAQDPYHLLHAQCIHPPERKSFWPSKAPRSHTFWTNHWHGPERVIFGHTVLDKPLVSEHAVGIDTGCVFGGLLTAVVLPAAASAPWEIVSVPSRQAFIGRAKSTDAAGSIVKYRIHGDVHTFS